MNLNTGTIQNQTTKAATAATTANTARTTVLASEVEVVAWVVVLDPPEVTAPEVELVGAEVGGNVPPGQVAASPEVVVVLKGKLTKGAVAEAVRLRRLICVSTNAKRAAPRAGEAFNAAGVVLAMVESTVETLAAPSTQTPEHESYRPLASVLFTVTTGTGVAPAGTTVHEAWLGEQIVLQSNERKLARQLPVPKVARLVLTEAKKAVSIALLQQANWLLNEVQFCNPVAVAVAVKPVIGQTAAP